MNEPSLPRALALGTLYVALAFVGLGAGAWVGTYDPTLLIPGALLGLAAWVLLGRAAIRKLAPHGDDLWKRLD